MINHSNSKMEECEANVQHFFDLARTSFDISPELSRGFIMELLEVLREAERDVPPHMKKVFCMKCFTLFTIGVNCKVLIKSEPRHPDLKILEYHCLGCRHVQRINATRAKLVKKEEPVVQKNEVPVSIAVKKTQQKRKLMMSLFS